MVGATTNACVENAKGIFRWELERMIDPNSNEQRYSYLDDDYAYLREIRYNVGETSYPPLAMADSAVPASAKCLAITKRFSPSIMTRVRS